MSTIDDASLDPAREPQHRILGYRYWNRVVKPVGPWGG